MYVYHTRNHAMSPRQCHTRNHECMYIWVSFVTCIPNEGRRLAGEKGGVIKILASVEQNCGYSHF